MRHTGIAALAAVALALSSCADFGWFAGMDVGRALGRNVGESLHGSQNTAETLYTGGSRSQFSNANVAEAKDAAVQITVRAVIAPNGPGSWVKDAPWNEVVFTLRNLTDHDIEVASVRGVTAQGVFIDQGGIEQMKELEEQKLAATTQVKHQRQPEVLSAFLPSMASTAVGMIPGVATLGGGMPLAGARTTFTSGMVESEAESQSIARQELQADLNKIAEEYHDRSLGTVRLASGGTVTSSAFFPISSGSVTELAFSIRENPNDWSDTELIVKLPSSTNSPHASSSIE
jgi:hypothetical protein